MRELIEILIDRINSGDITQNEIIDELEVLKIDASHMENLQDN